MSAAVTADVPTRDVIRTTNDIRVLYNILAGAIVDLDLPDDIRRDHLQLAGQTVPEMKPNQELVDCEEWRTFAANQDVRLRTFLISRLIGLREGHATCYLRNMQSISHLHLGKRGYVSEVHTCVIAGLEQYLAFLETQDDQGVPLRFNNMDCFTRRSAFIRQSRPPRLGEQPAYTHNRSDIIEGVLQSLNGDIAEDSSELIGRCVESLEALFDVLAEISLVDGRRNQVC